MNSPVDTPPSTRRGAQRPLLAAALGLAAAAAVLGLAEVGLRLAGYGGDPGDLYFTRLGERVLEPEMYAPERERFFTLRAPFRHSAEHAGPNALDAWPFRGRPLAPAPDDAWRIAVFGDSCAYGLPLPGNASLPTYLEAELRRRLGDERALVANLGVPGYSTVQIRAMVEEALERYAPDEVVLYPAAWNDQAPSMGRNDLELRDELARFAPLRDSGLASFLRGMLHADPPPLPLDSAAAAAAFGSRVPEDAVEGEVRAMIAACRERGVGVVVIAPPHPESRRESHPRMFRDADHVRSAAGALGVALVDEQARFGPPEVENLYFADLVHPAPEGHRVLAERVADALLVRAPGPPPWVANGAVADGALAVAEFEPAAVPELGDVELTLQLDGWTAADGLPAICIGGVALLDPVAVGARGVRGTLPHLAPGTAAVVVQTARGVARAAVDLRVEPPRLELLESPARVRITSRPGDTARVFVSTALRPYAKHSSRGAMWIEQAACLPLELAIACGNDGTGEVALPELERDGPLHVQALVVPRGEALESGFATWSTPAQLR